MADKDNEKNKEIICPYCGEHNNPDSNYCIKCGCSLTPDKIGCWVCSSLVILFMLIVFILGNNPQILKSTGNILQNMSWRAKPCDSDFVKNQAIEVFKQNNVYYKAMDKNSIATIKLENPTAESYDKSVDKYSCTGTITMTSPNGFRPTRYKTPDNIYYAHVFKTTALLSDDYYYYIPKYTNYSCNIEYTSQKSEGQNIVKATACRTSDNWLEEFNEDKFSCDSDECERIRVENEE